MSKLDIRGPEGSSPSALHARLSSERPSSAILLATGSAASPGFAEASFEDAAGALLLTSSTAATDDQAEGGDAEEIKGDKGALAHVVGPGELGIRGSEKDAAAAGGGDADDDEEGGDRCVENTGERVESALRLFRPVLFVLRPVALPISYSVIFFAPPMSKANVWSSRAWHTSISSSSLFGNNDRQSNIADLNDTNVTTSTGSLPRGTAGTIDLAPPPPHPKTLAAPPPASGAQDTHFATKNFSLSTHRIPPPPFPSGLRRGRRPRTPRSA